MRLSSAEPHSGSSLQRREIKKKRSLLIRTRNRKITHPANAFCTAGSRITFDASNPCTAMHNRFIYAANKVKTKCKPKILINYRQVCKSKRKSGI
jgi:hypothetical protein